MSLSQPERAWLVSGTRAPEPAWRRLSNTAVRRPRRRPRVTEALAVLDALAACTTGSLLRTASQAEGTLGALAQKVRAGATWGEAIDATAHVFPPGTGRAFDAFSAVLTPAQAAERTASLLRTGQVATLARAAATSARLIRIVGVAALAAAVVLLLPGTVPVDAGAYAGFAASLSALAFARIGSRTTPRTAGKGRDDQARVARAVALAATAAGASRRHSLRCALAATPPGPVRQLLLDVAAADPDPRGLEVELTAVGVTNAPAPSRQPALLLAWGACGTAWACALWACALVGS